jgi:hypothetical protein
MILENAWVDFSTVQVVEDLVDGLPAKDIDTEKLVRFAESVVLRKVGRDGSETLAIARFNPFQGYIEERDRTVNILCWLLLGIVLKVDEG